MLCFTLIQTGCSTSREKGATDSPSPMTSKTKESNDVSNAEVSSEQLLESVRSQLLKGVTNITATGYTGIFYGHVWQTNSVMVIKDGIVDEEKTELDIGYSETTSSQYDLNNDIFSGERFSRNQTALLELFEYDFLNASLVEKDGIRTISIQGSKYGAPLTLKDKSGDVTMYRNDFMFADFEVDDDLNVLSGRYVLKVLVLSEEISDVDMAEYFEGVSTATEFVNKNLFKYLSAGSLASRLSNGQTMETDMIITSVIKE